MKGEKAGQLVTVKDVPLVTGPSGNPVWSLRHLLLSFTKRPGK
jgi:hypothetical protein